MLDSAEATDGWGKNNVLEVAGERVFVKRIPMTDLEFDNPFSTRNLYALPTFYNYGVGSAGLGVYRELVANIKTTNWVLDGEIQTFPLMYHHRICQSHGERQPLDIAKHHRYVEYWDGNVNIGQYMLDRLEAKHELVLFLEHIPNVLHPWLKENPHRTTDILDQLRATLEFLRKNDIIHFDAHFHNILIGGDRPYLTDFGLVLDKSFELTVDEIAFFAANSAYDFGQVLCSISYLIESQIESLAESERKRVQEKYGFDDQTPGIDRLEILFDNLDELQVNGIVTLDRGYLDCVVKYQHIIMLVRRFYSGLQRNNRKDNVFPNDELKSLLSQTGFAQF